MKKLLGCFLCVMLLFCLATPAIAIPILNDGSTVPIQYLTDGVTSFGTYINSSMKKIRKTCTDISGKALVDYFKGWHSTSDDNLFLA